MAGNDLTQPVPVRPAQIEPDVDRLLKDWVGAMKSVADVLQNSRTFVKKWGRANAIAALGDRAAPIQAAYTACKPIVEAYTSAGVQADL